MSEVLTIDEIESRFDSEWILVEDPELDEQLNVMSGRVAWHSKDRHEVHQKLLELRPKHSAVLYIGGTSEGMEYALATA